MSGSVTCNGSHLRTCYEGMSDDKDVKDTRFSLETVIPSCGPSMRVSGRQPLGSSACSRDSKDRMTMDHLQGCPSTNETLYVTPEEFHLWKILQGTLDLSLWKVKVGWQLVQNSAIISFFGPQKVASDAKIAISKLMILLNSTVRMNPWAGLTHEERRMSGFFQVGDDLNLYLWKGEASTFRASVIMSLSSRPPDRYDEVKSAPKVRVLRQRILNDRGIPQVLLQVVLLSAWAGYGSGRNQASESQELTASAVTLALQAASQEKSASLVIHPTVPAALAKGITLGVQEFKSIQPTRSHLRNLTIAVNDNDFVAECEAECCRSWPRRKDHLVLLPYIMSSWEDVITQVVVGSLINQKTDVVVLPLILEPHSRSWVQETTTQIQSALETLLDGQNLLHGNIITIPASSLPGLHCQILYIICLDAGLVQQHLEGSKQIIHQMVWSCLNNFLGSFLESISFPLLDLETPGNSNSLHIMLEEINNFLKQKPNTWMKLVQIIQPLRVATPQKVSEDFRTPLEAIGLCQKEDRAFVQYLNDSPAVFQEFEDDLKKTGCVFQTCASLGVLKFIAEGEHLDPSSWEKAVEEAFQKNKKRYAVHYEGNSNIINVLKKQQSLVKSFKTIQEYEGPCFVGPIEEVKMFVQCVHEMAFNEKLVCVEHPVLHLPRYMVVKNTISKSFLLPHSPVTIVLEEDPIGMITFQGPQQDVLEVEKQFYSLLSGFKDWPISLSPFQVQFIQSLQEELFNENFFLAQDILAVLNTSNGVKILGLDFGELVQAEEFLKTLVYERKIDIEEDVQWATIDQEWKALLIELSNQKKVTFYSVKSQQDILTSVVIVGSRIGVTEAEISIREYLMSYSIIEDKVISPRPELAEARENLLRIMSWGNLKVNICIETNHSTLTLKLRGLRRHVNEARVLVQTDLDSLTVRSIPIRHREIQQYLLGSGATVLVTFAEELQCLLKMQVPEEATNALLSEVPVCREESEGTFVHELLKVLRRHRNEHFTLGDSPLGLVQVLGREVNLAKFQEVFEDFMNGYYSETFNSDKIITFSENCLQEVLDQGYYFPLNLHRHGNLLKIQGFWEDVKKAATAVQTLIQEAQDTDRAAEALKSVVQWQYDLGNTGLSPFDKTTNLKLETAYRKEEENIEIILDSRRTQVNLKKRKGLVPETGTIFKIKREIYIWEMSAPQHWRPMNGDSVKIVKLPSNMVEYQRVAGRFKCSMNNSTILKIERIQNPYLWTSYIYKRNWMEKKNPPGVQNEQFLFHGTLAQNCSSIIENGLKSTCRKNGMYGQGIYFAVDAQLSSHYCEKGHQGSRFMFQVRVLTGEYSKGHTSITLPPEKPGGGRYDSLVDSVGMPRIFVTFFDDHSYPEYLITFH